MELCIEREDPCSVCSLSNASQTSDRWRQAKVDSPLRESVIDFLCRMSIVPAGLSGGGGTLRCVHSSVLFALIVFNSFEELCTVAKSVPAV